MHQNGVICTDLVPRLPKVTVLQGRLIIQDKLLMRKRLSTYNVLMAVCFVNRTNAYDIVKMIVFGTKLTQKDRKRKVTVIF